MSQVNEWMSTYGVTVAAFAILLAAVWNLYRTVRRAPFLISAVVLGVVCILYPQLIDKILVLLVLLSAWFFREQRSLLAGASGSGVSSGYHHDADPAFYDYEASGSSGEEQSRPRIPFDAPIGYNPYEQEVGAHVHGYDPTRDPSSEHYRG